MHVLIIPSEHYLPADDPLEGIFQHDQASALKRSGVRVGILSVELRGLVLLKKRVMGWLSGQYVSEEAGIPVYRHHGWFWPQLWSRGYLRQYLDVGLRLYANYLNKQGVPDLIHAHNVLNAGILAAEIKKLHGIPYIITEHSSAYAREEAISQTDYGRVRQAYIEADLCLAVSRKLCLMIDNYFGGKIGPLQVMPNMLDAIFEQIDVFPSSEGRKFTFINVGRLVEVKQQELLLAAFALGFKGQSNVCLRIVGTGPRLIELEKIAYESGVADQVIFTGELDRSGVLDEMLNCDVYVHSSKFETFGVVIIEAMACGKPVVTTACGGPDDMITPENGKLVPVGDIEALAASMDYVMKHKDSYDSERIRNDCFERFSGQVVSQALITKYEEVLQKKRKKLT